MDRQLEKYGNVSEVYSEPFGFLSRNNRNHAKKQSYILEAADITGSDTVLEVGCGHGLHSPGYERACAEYHGIDISESLVRATRDKLQSGSVYAADAHDPPYAENTFDAVVGTAILHHLHDQERALRAWARITKPGGVIALMEPNYLFPKDLVTAHVIEEEQHKTELAPWRVTNRLDALQEDDATKIESFSVRPRLYSPPWPTRLHGVFDRVDTFGEHLPVLRWCGQMLQITIQC